jgi:predicted dehydrogenase
MIGAKVGIVGLGRWAKVLARASRNCDTLEITAAYSRTEEKRTAFARESLVWSAPHALDCVPD